MSYTFSRRDFIKYSAVAAVAVAGSSMFTGCGFSNPNRPYGTYTGEDCQLTFGGKTDSILGFGGTQDYQILKADAAYNGTTLILPFEHYAVSQGCSCKNYSYQIDVTTADGIKSYTNGSACGKDENVTTVNIVDNGGSTAMIPKEKYTPIITVNGIDFTGAKKVEVRYFPRHNALGKPNDTYSDVYASWDISCLFDL